MEIEVFKMSVVKDSPRINNGHSWANWGIDNYYPYQLLHYYDTSRFNARCINFKADLTAGDGFIVPTGMEDFFKNNDLDNVLERISKDMWIYGAWAVQVISDKFKGVAAKIEYIDISSIRLLKDDNENVVVSRDWRDSMETKSVFRKWNQKTLKKDKIQIYIHMKPNPGMYFYAKPDYDCALEDIELESEIKLFDLNCVRNGYYPGIIFDFPEKPSKEERQVIKQSLKTAFQGGQGAGQAVVLFNDDPNKKVQITPITPSNNTNVLENLKVWNRSCIMIGHGITSPELLGIESGGSSLGGDANKISVSYELFYNTVIKKKQNQIMRVFQEILDIDELTIANSKPISYIPETVLLNNFTVTEIREMYGYPEQKNDQSLEKKNDEIN